MKVCFETSKEGSGLYIKAGSLRSLPASLGGFAGHFHYFTSQDMKPANRLPARLEKKIRERMGVGAS